MKTTIELNFEGDRDSIKPRRGVYRLTAEWPELLLEPTVFQWSLTEEQLDSIERVANGDPKLFEKEIIAALMKDALWQVQAYLFKNLQK